MGTTPLMHIEDEAEQPSACLDGDLNLPPIQTNMTRALEGIGGYSAAYVPWVIWRSGSTQENLVELKEVAERGCGCG